MLYVDNARIPYWRMKMCHLTADTTEELFEAADKLGLKARWVQHPGTPHEHLDVSLSKRQVAIDQLGAKQVTSRELVRVIQQKRRDANLDGAFVLRDNGEMAVVSMNPK